MKSVHYQAIYDYLQKHSYLKRLVLFVSKFFPAIVFVVYGLLASILLLCQDPHLIRFLLVPLLTFLFVSIFRYLLNAPRPYDQLEYQTFLPYQKGKGKSFPSRHTASAVIIAMAGWYLSTWIGIVLSIIALMIGISRVLAGFHYPKDVLAGIGISLCFGVIGFFIL